MIEFSGRVLLLDIEGTVSNLAFVHEILFPYARREVRGFLDHSGTRPEVAGVLATMAKDAGAENFAGWCPFPVGGTSANEWVAQRVQEWMDRDAKLTGLKALQGLIWERGYREGVLRSHVFPDVLPSLKSWVAAKRSVAIYSSGSVAAQRLFFRHTVEGDLTSYITDYFDTTTGGKRESASYQSIAQHLACPAAEILFLSDVAEELAAASEAGLPTGLVTRPGNRPTEDPHHRRIGSLTDIRLIPPAI